MKGLALHQSGHLSQAQALYEQLLRIQPRHFDALHLLGVIAYQAKQLNRSVELIGRAIAINPNVAAAYSNRGLALKDLGQLEAALASFDKAIALQLDYAEAYYNRGVALQELKQLEAALTSFDRAIALKVDFIEAHFRQSLVFLLMGDFKRGWEKHEWGWDSPNGRGVKRDFLQPLWLGTERLQGKTILLHAEQGLGDTLQFCRYAKLVSDLGARVILEVQPSLVNLMASLEGVDGLVVRGGALPAFDYQCPLLSLPLAFKTDLAGIPSAPSYIKANPGKLAHWDARLGEKRKPRIGVVWSGNTLHKNDHNRSIALTDLAKLLSADYEFVSLQKEVREQDKEVLQAHPEIRHFGDELKDFADTAALCELMDVVISVDTSVAHLAGALGKPVWILLPYVPDWRWLLDREDSPWYSSARLYRQEKLGDWGGVIERVKVALTTFCSTQRR